MTNYKNHNFTIIFISIICIAFFSVFFGVLKIKENNSKNLNNKIFYKKETEKPLVLNEENENFLVLNEKTDSYQIGYNQGYNAFMAQIGKHEEKVNTYTVNMESEAIDQDEIDEGYVDGYHKAAESTHCPRNCPY